MKARRKLIPGLSVIENFKITMMKEGLSVAQLAAKANVSRGSIYRYFKVGRVRVVRPELLRVAHVLGYSEEEVRGKMEHEALVEKCWPRTKRDKILQLIADLVQLL